MDQKIYAPYDVQNSFRYNDAVQNGAVSDDDAYSPFFDDIPRNATHNRHTDKLNYIGGNINTNSTSFKYIIITLLVIFIIYLLYRIYMYIQYNGEDYNQRKVRHHFNNLHGEAYDEDAKQAIAFGEAIEQPRAIDHYRLGTVYLVNANNPRQAHRHFNQALTQIIGGLVDTREAPYILNHIDDFKDHFFDFPDIEELPIQHAMLAHFNQQRKQLNQVITEKKEIAKDDPEFTQKMLLSRQAWNSDSQNVHDTAIYETLKDQFLKVRDENAKLPHIKQHNYDEAVQWLKMRYENDPIKKSKVEKVISTLNNNHSISSITNTGEKDILTAVWQRTYDLGNALRANDMREAIADAVLDCVEGNSVVCMAGRNSKIWQALARLDKDESMGILKSKQLIRNEIFERAAKIVDEHIGDKGSASDALKAAYTKGEESEQVQELTETMRKQIDNIHTTYKGLISKEQLDQIIMECKMAI